MTAIMFSDYFSRICLAAIVVLLAVVAFRTNPVIVQAAAPNTTSYVCETTADSRVSVDHKCTDHANEMARQGWRITAAVSSGLIWEKQASSQR